MKGLKTKTCNLRDPNEVQWKNLKTKNVFKDTNEVQGKDLKMKTCGKGSQWGSMKGFAQLYGYPGSKGAYATASRVLNLENKTIREIVVFCFRFCDK